MVGPLILFWDAAFMRALILAWFVVVCSAFPFLFGWFMPRWAAIFALPVEDFIERTDRFGETLHRPKWKIAVGLALGSLGIVMPHLAFALALWGPYTENHMYSMVYRLLAVGLLSIAAFIWWSVPVTKSFDEVVVGRRFVRRQHLAAASFLAGGAVFMMISLAAAP
jgi:hypothetical protein